MAYDGALILNNDQATPSDTLQALVSRGLMTKHAKSDRNRLA